MEFQIYLPIVETFNDFSVQEIEWSMKVIHIYYA